jgi:hypothetical protein
VAWSWYTKGRRIPTLIGKDVSGRRIPGGPYTGLQAVTAAAVPAVLWWTRALWAADLAGLVMFGVIIGATVAGVKLIGKVDFASRNPVLLLGSYLRQTSRPLSGTLAGRKLAEPRPRRLSGVIDVTYTELDDLHGNEHEKVELAAPAAPARSSHQHSSLPAPAEPAPAAADAADPTAATAPVALPSPSASREQPGKTAVWLEPAAPPAPDRRRSGLDAFLAAAATARPAQADQDAA